MKHKPILLLCLLVGPALAMPNQEPIYRRANSNPLEVTEEMIPTTNAQPLVALSNGDPQTSASESSATTTTTTSTTSTPAPSTAQDQNSSLLLKRPDTSLKTKIGTSGYVVSTSTKILTSAGLQHQLKGVASEGKANDHIVKYDTFPTHAGVAEPMSDEDYHKELNMANDRVHIRAQPTTTSREGLSTWVLLSGSNSVTSTESKKEIVNTTKRPYTTTTRRPATTSARKPMTTPRRRTTTTTRTPPGMSDEKKEKINKLMTRMKIAAANLQETLKPKLEDNPAKIDVITKKPRKPVATVPTTTTVATTTTTELAITESPVSTTVADESSHEDNAIETSTFLILEPKDAMFDLPQDRSPSKVGKKKPTTKTTTSSTKKKTATKKKKPAEKDSGLTKLSGKKPPQKNKPMSTQIMNYLSREVMPTVGVGLVGLMLTAGLASYFLGSPLTAALRRSDETNRKDDVYYSNYEDYANSDGQNEEEVFGKLIAGMPDRSYYRPNNIRRRTSQPVRTGHQYGNYHVQTYSANKYPHINYRNRAAPVPAPAYAGTPEMYATYNRNVQAKSHNEFYYNTPPSFYTKPNSPVFVTPESTTYTTTSTTQTPLTSAEPTSEMIDDVDEQEHELLPNPAAYTAEHSPEHHAQYVVGSVYPEHSNVYPDNSMLDIITSAPVPEHGPRRRKRELSVESEEIEFDNEIGGSEEELKQDTSSTSTTSSPSTTIGLNTEVTTEDEKVEPGSNPITEHPITWSDLLRNTVEMKLAMSINLLQQMTSQFQRYLNGVQHRVEDHFNRTVVHQ